MIVNLKNLRKNWRFASLLFVFALIHFLTPQTPEFAHPDTGQADVVPMWTFAAAKRRPCRRRVRKISFWRYLITVIPRNRNAAVVVPQVQIEKLAESQAFQRFIRKKAQAYRKSLNARIRQFDDYLQSHPEEIQQLAEQYDAKIKAIMASPPVIARIKIFWQRLRSALMFQYLSLREMPRQLRFVLGLLVCTIVLLMLSLMKSESWLMSLAGGFAFFAINFSSSVIIDNHHKYQEINDKLVSTGYQPLFNFDWWIECNQSVLYPTVLDNFNWSIYTNLAKKYSYCYSDFLEKARQKTNKKKHQKANQQCQQLDLSLPLEPGDRFCNETLATDLGEIDQKELQRLNNKGNAGRNFEHDFLPLYKAFVILRFMDIKPSVANIIRTLCGNPYLLVKLNFRDNRLPSPRVIYRFDQVMSQYGLWNEAFEIAVRNNIQRGIIDPEKETFFGSDTSHTEACATRGKKKKNCAYCPKLADCPNPQPTDNTAATLFKKPTVSYHAHKVAFANLLHSELCLAFKVFKGSTNDAETLPPLLKKFKEQFPEFNFSHVLVDGIYDNRKCDDAVKFYYPQATMYTSKMNPKNRKDKLIGQRGIHLVNKRGQVICINRQKMAYISRDLKNQTFIWGCPFYHPDVISDKKFTAKEKYQILQQWKYSRDVKGTAELHGITPKILKTWKSRMNCARDKKLDPKGLRGLENDCPVKEQCCPNTKHGRIFRTRASDYPFLDWNSPQYGYHRQVVGALRLANERIISRLKENLSSDKLFKQNDFNVEAHVAKSLVAQHIFAAVAFSLERPEAIRRIKTFHSIFQRTS